MDSHVPFWPLVTEAIDGLQATLDDLPDIPSPEQLEDAFRAINTAHMLTFPDLQTYGFEYLDPLRIQRLEEATTRITALLKNSPIQDEYIANYLERIEQKTMILHYCREGRRDKIKKLLKL